MEPTTIIAFIVAILGSGGISAVLTSLLSARKFKSEAEKISQEAYGIHMNTEIKGADYVSQQLQAIADNAAKESETLRARNDELNARINELNDKLQALMQWIVTDNQRYRQYLESELLKLNPEMDFPECPPPPRIFKNE